MTSATSSGATSAVSRATTCSTPGSSPAGRTGWTCSPGRTHVCWRRASLRPRTPAGPRPRAPAGRAPIRATTVWTTGTAPRPVDRRRRAGAGGPRRPPPTRWITATGSDAPAGLAEAVAHRPHGLDEAGVLLAQLGPEAADVDVHRAGAAVVLVTPHPGEQGFPGE